MTPPSALPVHLAIVGDGRLGRTLVAALPGVSRPYGRGYDGRDADAVLLCVPDAEIAAAAAAIVPGPLVGTARAPRASTCSPRTRRSACIR